MSLSVLPTRVEILNEEMKQLVATVEAVDEVACKVEICQIVGWDDWLNVADAVRRAMHMMDMHKFDDQKAVPHGN